jgi:hypothetical protein
MTSLKSIIKADYLQRTRSYGFLITLLASVCIAYTFVPSKDARYSTVRIGNYIGESNAAWIGHVTAIMASIFLWLIGYYLVNDGIKKDKETGVGQIIATTSITNFKYLFAKALSNFFVLLTIAIIIMFMALSLVFVRGHNYPFNFSQFLLPYLFATLPCIFCVSVIAVFSEVIFGKYSIAQNIAFFFLFPVLTGVQSLSSNAGMYWLDVLGTKFISEGMVAFVNLHFHQSINTVSSGFLFISQSDNKYFLFEGTHWSAIYILSRLLWIGVAFLLLLVSSRLFRRFDAAEITTGKKKKEEVIKPKLPLKEIRLSTLPVASPGYGIWPFVKTELLMLIRIGPKWFWLINIGGFIALFFIPLATAHSIALPIIWFLQVNRWADIATKEKFNRTHYFTYAAYKPLQRLLSSQIIAGILLAITFSLPLIFRYVIKENYSEAFSLVSGAMFIVFLSVFTGIMFGGKRFFEIAFFILTYCNISATPAFDYFGAFNHGIAYIALIAAINCVLLLGAFVLRDYEIRNQ